MKPRPAVTIGFFVWTCVGLAAAGCTSSRSTTASQGSGVAPPQGATDFTTVGMFEGDFAGIDLTLDLSDGRRGTLSRRRSANTTDGTVPLGSYQGRLLELLIGAQGQVVPTEELGEKLETKPTALAQNLLRLRGHLHALYPGMDKGVGVSPLRTIPNRGVLLVQELRPEEQTLRTLLRGLLLDGYAVDANYAVHYFVPTTHAVVAQLVQARGETVSLEELEATRFNYACEDSIYTVVRRARDTIAAVLAVSSTQERDELQRACLTAAPDVDASPPRSLADLIIRTERGVAPANLTYSIPSCIWQPSASGVSAN